MRGQEEEGGEGYSTQGSWGKSFTKDRQCSVGTYIWLKTVLASLFKHRWGRNDVENMQTATSHDGRRKTLVAYQGAEPHVRRPQSDQTFMWMMMMTHTRLPTQQKV